MARFTIFLGAFLAFLVQPLVGNTLLPAFGGAASVWNWCLAGFQILLVAGYFYAHLTARHGVTRPRDDRGGATPSRPVFGLGVHCLLVVLSAVGLVAIGFGLRSPWAVVPFVAFPYILLAANSSLVQVLSGGRYTLYSVSNIGSFAGLFAYPFLFELFLPLRWQWTVMAVLTICYAIALYRLAGRNHESGIANEECRSVIIRTSDFGYAALAFASCFLLNAVTAHLGSDITPIPLLWSVLLGVYLLSYVIAFTERGSRLYRWLTIPTALVAVYAVLRLVLVGGRYFTNEMVTATLLLFLGGLAIHSRLYRNRPCAAELTRFYLMIALGGACGGAVCSFVMPRISVTVLEYPIAVASVFFVLFDSKSMVVRVLKVLLAVVLLLAGVAFQYRVQGEVLARYRNDYGTGMVVRRPVRLSNGTYYMVHEFRSNSTTHGIQCLNGRGLVYGATAYFTSDAGGSAIVRHPKFAKSEPMRVAVLGMGVGILATYSRAGDVYRMYEINPAVKKLALDRRLFTFISDAKGKVEIVLDDARKALERECAAKLPRFDVIYVDVFNGDSIPPHMSTREAFRLYRDCLEPDGIIALNITNWHLDLLPMVKAAAADLGMNILAVDCLPSAVSAGSCWVFMSAGRVDGLFVDKRQKIIDISSVPDLPPMTDEFHSILPYVKSEVLPHWGISPSSKSGAD